MAKQHDKLNLMQSSTIRITKISEYVMCRKSWHRIQHINKMAERLPESVIFLFVVLVIMHLMSRRKLPRLRRELRDAQDALDVLKKAINILGK